VEAVFLLDFEMAIFATLSSHASPRVTASDNADYRMGCTLMAQQSGN
jgi:hypothetical protein